MYKVIYMNCAFNMTEPIIYRLNRISYILNFSEKSMVKKNPKKSNF